MASSKAPSHIRLPPQPDPADVFSRNTTSALSTTPLTPSAPNTPISPRGSPHIPGPRKSQSKQTLNADVGGSGARTRRTTFMDVSPSGEDRMNPPRRQARTSFSSSTGRYPRDRRMSRASTIGRRVSAAVSQAEGGDGDGKDDGEVAIPTLKLGIRPAYSTPLPLLPMVVLSVAMMSELLSANVCTPFLLQMVESFFVPDGQVPTSEQSSSIGLWTGNLVSVFYITQFLTSLLWSGIADRHGRRAILIGSMLGSALSVITFGTSGSLPEAIAIRLVQGIFGGAIGVFRGSIRDITDATNETRAYAILSFCWGLGGVIGPILGGVLESPAKKFPGIFGNIPLFSNLPYLLPTVIAGIILSSGALLATGLSWDGGPRRKKIALSIEKDEPLTESNGAVPLSPSRPSSPSPGQDGAELAGSIRKKPSSIFLSENVVAAIEDEPTGQTAKVLALRDLEAQERARRASRNSVGAAVGYGGIRVKREFMAQQHAQAAARRMSTATIRPGDEEAVGAETSGGEAEHMNLTERFLIANENNQFNIQDLWVSAAIALDTAVFDDEDEYDEDNELRNEGADEEEAIHGRDASASYLTTPASRRDGRSPSVSPAALSHRDERSPLLEISDPHQPGSTIKARLPGVGHPGGEHPRNFSINRVSGNHNARRFSAASGAMPAIFNNTGLNTPPAIAAAYDVDPLSENEQQPLPSPLFRPNHVQEFSRYSTIEPIVEGVAFETPVKQPMGGLSAINESSNTASVVGFPPTTEVEKASEPTGWKLLPMLIIISYGALAFHDTVHGQIFISFIFTPYVGGGLGLQPAAFSILVAVMCCFQLYFQFVAYSSWGPPRGKLSHLAMFRIGSCLFIPAYLTLPLLRSFVTPGQSGGPLIMTLLIINMAVRYMAGTFSYTAVMILINAMSPPSVVGLANGLAQSFVSLSRFMGPVIGGAIWSGSISGNPDGFSYGFYVVSVICGLQIGLSYLIR